MYFLELGFLYRIRGYDYVEFWIKHQERDRSINFNVSKFLLDDLVRIKIFLGLYWFFISSFFAQLLVVISLLATISILQAVFASRRPVNKNHEKRLSGLSLGFDKPIEYLNSGLPLVSSHFQHQSVQ